MAIDCDNIYSLEILLDALALMGAQNIKAENKYNELAR